MGHFSVSNGQEKTLLTPYGDLQDVWDDATMLRCRNVVMSQCRDVAMSRCCTSISCNDAIGRVVVAQKQVLMP